MGFQKSVYLDHQATTYLRPEISELLVEYDTGKKGFGNPSSDTAEGRTARELVVEARREIAGCLSVIPETIFFTGSGTEANNLAIKGIAFQHMEKRGHLITTTVEHPSVLQVMEYLQTLGFAVTYLEVDRDGRVTADTIRMAIRKETILVTVMAVNNEIGAINPVSEIGLICRKYHVPLMVDAIQAFGKIPLSPAALGISLLTFSGHKFYGPKGIGGLYLEPGITLVPVIHGGGQEKGLRSGTENVGAIMAMGKAAKLSHGEMEQETVRLLALRRFFLEQLSAIVPEAIVNGSLEYRIPHNLSIGFPNVDDEALFRGFDRIGVCVSGGSACHCHKPSYVLKAIGADTEKYTTVRFGFGLKTTREELEYLFYHLPGILQASVKGDASASSATKCEG